MKGKGHILSSTTYVREFLKALFGGKDDLHYVEQITDGKKRTELLEQRDETYEKWKADAEHSPVGWVLFIGVGENRIFTPKSG